MQGMSKDFVEATFNSELLTTIDFDMANYLKSVRAIFVAEIGKTLKPGMDPVPPRNQFRWRRKPTEQPIKFGGGGYNYFYNLTDSAKFSFLTNQHIRTSNAVITEFGGGLMPQASEVTGFQIGSYDSSNYNFSLTASLYGIRFS